MITSDNYRGYSYTYAYGRLAVHGLHGDLMVERSRSYTDAQTRAKAWIDEFITTKEKLEDLVMRGRENNLAVAAMRIALESYTPEQLAAGLKLQDLARMKDSRHSPAYWLAHYIIEQDVPPVAEKPAEPAAQPSHGS